MLSPAAHLKRYPKIAIERKLLTDRAHRMLDALLRVERGIPSGTRQNVRFVAREKARVKLFEKEIATCRAALKKLGG